MSPFRRTAIPAAVILVAALSACQDAPLAPHDLQRAIPRAPAASQSMRVRTFSGQRADSAINELLGTWAAHGHPEFQRARAAWHPKSSSASAGAAALNAKTPTASSALLDVTAAGSSTPEIVQHHESLYFGHYGDGFSVPSGINAWMQFVGDQGRIDLAGFTISGSGGSYTASGPIASGSGQFSSCSDIILGQCGSVKEMEGAMILDSAPTCDASGSGNVVYTAFNMASDFTTGTSLVPLSTNSGGVGASAVANATVSGSAGSCTNNDGNTTGSAPGGGDDEPPPVWPENPSPTPDPWAPPLSGGTTHYHCETTQWWQDGFVTLESTTCYPDD